MQGMVFKKQATSCSKGQSCNQITICILKTERKEKKQKVCETYSKSLCLNNNCRQSWWKLGLCNEQQNILMVTWFTQSCSLRGKKKIKKRILLQTLQKLAWVPLFLELSQPVLMGMTQNLRPWPQQCAHHSVPCLLTVRLQSVPKPWAVFRASGLPLSLDRFHFSWTLSSHGLKLSLQMGDLEMEGFVSSVQIAEPLFNLVRTLCAGSFWV